MTLKLRTTLFVVLVLACLAVSVGYVWKRSQQLSAERPSANPRESGSIIPANAGQAPNDGPSGSASLREKPPTGLPRSGFVIFRSTLLGPSYGQLATASLDDPGASRTPVGFGCERAYFAGGYGVCLTAERGVITTYNAFIFDRSLQWRRDLPPLKGIPSRARVSPDGRYAAVTVFVSGHSYSPGTFSTRVEIYRTSDGSRVGELEEFSIEQAGKEFREIDFNFWGITFARDSNRFYATLGTRGNNYLVEGNLADRRAKVIHSGVECPSLSPDGTRIAFKRLLKSGWHIYVVNLNSGTEIPLAEMRNVDDQVEWLDDHHVLYAFDNDVWMVPANGEGKPAIFISSAYSPAVIR